MGSTHYKYCYTSNSPSHNFLSLHIICGSTFPPWKGGSLTSNRLELQEGRGDGAAQHLVLGHSHVSVPAAPYFHHFPIVHSVARGQRHLQPKKAR